MTDTCVMKASAKAAHNRFVNSIQRAERALADLETEVGHSYRLATAYSRLMEARMWIEEDERQ